MKVMGLNPGYLLKSTLPSKTRHWIDLFKIIVLYLLCTYFDWLKNLEFVVGSGEQLLISTLFQMVTRMKMKLLTMMLFLSQEKSPLHSKICPLINLICQNEKQVYNLPHSLCFLLSTNKQKQRPCLPTSRTISNVWCNKKDSNTAVFTILFYCISR